MGLTSTLDVDFNGTSIVAAGMGAMDEGELVRLTVTPFLEELLADTNWATETDKPGFEP